MWGRTMKKHLAVGSVKEETGMAESTEEVNWE